MKVKIVEKYRDTMMAGYNLQKNGDNRKLCWMVPNNDGSRIGFLFESGEYAEVEKPSWSRDLLTGFCAYRHRKKADRQREVEEDRFAPN